MILPSAWLFRLLHLAILASLACCLLRPCLAAPQVLFEETFENPELPRWHTQWHGAQVSNYAEADGAYALKISSDKSVFAMATVELPVEQAAGKLVIVESMLKADNIMPGENHYYTGKLILKWFGPHEGWTKGSESDFQGTFGWTLKRYAVLIPADTTKLILRIGLEKATGVACYSNLRVYTDPDIASPEAFKRQTLAQERAKMQQLLATGTVKLRATPGGAIDVEVDGTLIPRRLWNARIRQRLLETPVPPQTEGSTAAAVLSRAFAAQAASLTEGVAALKGQAASDRAVEVAGLRLRASLLAANARPGTPVSLSAGPGRYPVQELIFGNNVNWGEFDMVLDHTTGRFKPEFLERLRPMGVTFLRYPGGCNADVFDWRDAIGPMDKRPVQTYYNRTFEAPTYFGVDEFLRFCEREGITPLITTAFLKDSPEAWSAHPVAGKADWVPGYVKTAPDRVKLAADWVEYCNGSVETPMGKLRAQNGHPEPYGVVYWEVGNETWGADPVGTCTAEEYATAFPRYVKAMKERDPSIKVGLNGHVVRKWMDTVLRIGGPSADFVQIHTYIGGKTLTEVEPGQNDFNKLMATADELDHPLQVSTDLMDKNLDKRLPLAVTEFGMGSRGGEDRMVSMGTAVMVGDMIRQYLEHPDVFGANRWCLYENYFFTSLCGPSRGKQRPFRFRPDYGVFVIYAACRGPERLEVAGQTADLKAVLFDRGDSYGLVLLNRDADDFASVTLNLPGVASGQAELLLQTTAHALTGTEHDRELAQLIRTNFQYQAGEPIPVPPNSVAGLILKKQ